MGHRRGRMGDAQRREGDFEAATLLPAGPERDLRLARAQHAGAHIGRDALRTAAEDPDFGSVDVGEDYALIDARHRTPDAPPVRPEDAWADVAAAHAQATQGRVA